MELMRSINYDMCMKLIRVLGDVVDSRDIAMSSLFGVFIFLVKALLPPIYGKIISVLFQMVFLSLAYLMMGFYGSLLTGSVSGLLTALVRPGFAWMTFTFALLYGLMVGGCFRVFGVVDSGNVRLWRLVVSSLCSTVVVGASSAFVAIFAGLFPYDPFLVSMMMVAGAVQGVVGGVLSYYLFVRYIRDLAGG